jgi:hypothetical protein
MPSFAKSCTGNIYFRKTFGKTSEEYMLSDSRRVVPIDPDAEARQKQYERLCCKIQAWTEGVQEVLPCPQTSSRLEAEPFTDDCDGLRECTGTDAESAFYDARRAADVLREVEDRRLALA